MKLQANSLKIINAFTAQFNSAVRAQFIFFTQAINVSANPSMVRGGGVAEWKTEVKHLDKLRASHTGAAVTCSCCSTSLARGPGTAKVCLKGFSKARVSPCLSPFKDH